MWKLAKTRKYTMLERRSDECELGVSRLPTGYEARSCSCLEPNPNFLVVPPVADSQYRLSCRDFLHFQK